MLSKKAVKPAVRRELVDYARHQHDAGLRLTCREVGISDTVYRYQLHKRKDELVIQALQKAVERYPACGFSKLFKILRCWGIPGTINGFIVCITS
jgi:putative transposase